MYDIDKFYEWLDSRYYEGFSEGIMDIPEEEFYALEDAYRATLN